MKKSQLFESATFHLTAWYLGILITISLLFSVIIYQVSVSEISTRMGIFETRINSDIDTTIPFSFDFDVFRTKQLHESENRILLGLAYANVIILVVGGAMSYLLAKRTLKPIKESHEAQARFASDASHELRTPLAVMKSELEVALRDPKLSKDEMRELLESNLEEVNRLSDLSKTLLEFTRHDAEELEMKALSLKDIATKTINVHAVDKQRIHLTAATPATICANGPSITELLMILLDNALRYSPTDSEIDVVIDERETTVVCTITNQGDGIHPDDLPHVFERFYRGDHSRSSQNVQGYGLGLSLAKKIVELHNGSISIVSTPGKLTSVELTFAKLKS